MAPLAKQYNELSLHIHDILASALKGEPVSEADAVTLFSATGDDLQALLDTADKVREYRVGNRVSYVVNRNINFTNICYMGCNFCNFSKHRKDEGAELLSMEEVARRAKEAWDRGATEVCIQGGLHPDLPGDHYRNILRAVKGAVPDMHIHGFSPFEIWYGARKARQSYTEFLQDLKDNGLGSMPGTAAEIFDEAIRRRLTQNKLSTEEWVEIVRTAHKVGIPSTSTMMYGHLDGPEHWASHIALLRTIQEETGGFTEFVPLGFIHEDSPLYLENSDVRPGPTEDENLKVHAVARLMLQGSIDNIQVSWVKLGPAMAHKMLSCGVNDLGGVLMNESISRAAGASHGQEITANEMGRLIRAANRTPVQRTTIYKTLKVFEKELPPQRIPLVDRDSFEPLAFMELGARGEQAS